MRSAPLLSGERQNRIIANVTERAVNRRNFLLEQAYISGYPAGATPVPPYRQYQTLVALRDAGDPRYWKNTKAQADLEKLSQRFGAPPLLPVPSQAQPALPAPLPFAPPGIGAPVVPGGPPAQVPGLLSSLVGTQALRSVVRENQPRNV